MADANNPDQESTVPESSPPSVPLADTSIDLEAKEPEPASRPDVSLVAHNNPKGWLIILFVLAVLAAGGLYYYLHYYHKTTAVVVAPKRDIPLIRYGTANGPVNVFYPSPDTTIVSGEQEVNAQLFEGLVAWQNGTKLVPLLATGWKNPDESTWVFTLRHDVKFHTGNTMTAADVKYSLDSFKTTAFGGAFGDTIKSVTVVSPYQVKITTDGPDPLLLNRLANLYIVDSKGTKPNDPANGTGPYVLKAGAKLTADFSDLVANDAYWGGHVYTRELQFSQILNEPAQVAALKNHQIDLFDQFIDAASITDLKAAQVQVNSQPSLVVDQVFLNTLKKNSPLNNLKFRQALNVGINRAAIVKAGGVDGTPIGQFMTAQVPGYVPKLKAESQDLAQAKTLITDSGVKNPTLTLSYGSDTSNDKLLAEFQKECAVLGVTVKLDPIDDIGDLVDKFQKGQTDMMFIANSSTLLDGSDVLIAFQNPGVYDNADADKLLDQANQTLDGAKHLSLLQQAAVTLNNDMAGIPMYTRASDYAQVPHNFRITNEIPSVQASAYFWKVYQQ